MPTTSYIASWQLSAYIDYFVKGKPFKIKQPTDFNNFFCYYADEFLQNVLYITFNWYGELDESNEEELRFKRVINANFNVQAFDKSVLELLQADNDKHFNFFLQTLGEKYGKLYKEMYVYVVGINERYKELSENITDEEIKDMIVEADKDQDGAVGESDFESIMKKTNMKMNFVETSDIPIVYNTIEYYPRTYFENLTEELSPITQAELDAICV